MTTCNPGDVVLVRYPFTDLAATKQRPAVVLSSPAYQRIHNDVAVIALTSQPQSDDQLQLQQWEQAGLPKPTWLKPLIATISAQIVERKLGALTEIDQRRVSTALRVIIDPSLL